MSAVEDAAPTQARRGAGLVVSMLKIGTIGFGGGSALIPVFDDEIVRRRRVLEAETFTRHTVVASITPGALPVKLAGFVGLEVSGGGLAALLALMVALPGTVLSLLLVATVSSADAGVIRYVEYASVGITAFIIALLVHYIASVHHGAAHRGLSLGITVAAALASGTPALVRVLGLAVGQEWRVQVPKLTALELIGLTLLLIVVRTALRRAGGAGAPDTIPAPAAAGRASLWPVARRAVLVLSGLAVAAVGVAVTLAGSSAATFLALVSLSTVSSFGGGEAYVAVADGFFVAGGLLDPATYYTQLVPIANALPGPILVKLAAAIGYVVGGAGLAGWALGTAAALVAVATTTAVGVLLLAAYDRMRTSPLLADVGAYVLPVIAGMLIATSAGMLAVSADVAATAGVAPASVVGPSVLAAAAVLWLRRGRRVPDLALLAVCAVLSVAGLAAA